MASITSYGTWPSPVTTALMVADSVRLSGIALDAGYAYWLEGRPGEGGRNVLVRADASGARMDVTPAPFNVRTRAHEYGGGAYLVSGNWLWFVNYEDQRIYAARGATPPSALTDAGPYRYADFILDGARQRLICVREDHSRDGEEPVNSLVAVAIGDGTVTSLAEGHDFYASPCLSPDGGWLAWITWDHPDMPWDASELWLAQLDGNGRPGTPQRLAGGRDRSVFQPAWRSDGTLFFVTDPRGWWNLHCWASGEPRPVLSMEAEFGRPQWQFAMSTYGFAAGGEIVCCYTRDGSWYLAHLARDAERLEPIASGLSDIESIAVSESRALLLGGSSTHTSAVVSLDLNSGERTMLRESAPRQFHEAYVSTPEAIDYETSDGQRTYAFFYPPCNPDFQAPADERPPLMVISHGGPTGATSGTLSLAVQYWTTRGFAVLDVNYRGSTGYGRAYRELLNGRWGVADVDDCVNGARYLVDSGVVDGERLIIRGSSAGGYTTLAALAFHDVFRAGASYYGISDLEALAEDTHKFESRYLDRLIGPYPETRQRYVERSPIHALERFSCPVIFFQGLEDKVVPPAQAERMVEALRHKGIVVEYLCFEGEQHGFRKAETIERTLRAELDFYGRVFGFMPCHEPPGPP